MSGSAVDRLVEVLSFRDSLGPCYLLSGERDLVALWVPTMLTSRTYEPLRDFRQRTIKAAIESGRAAIGPARRSEDVLGMPARRIVAPLQLVTP